VSPGGDLEAVVLLEGGVVEIAARLLEPLFILLVPHIADSLEEEKREDELLVVACVDQTSEQGRGAPEV
jgi:hypothetical protein